MKGRHLWRALRGNPGRATASRALRVIAFPGATKVSGRSARCEALLAQLHEGVDIELVDFVKITKFWKCSGSVPV